MKLEPEIRILLADDDIDDRFFFEKALSELPIATRLECVNDGEALIEYLHAHQKNLPDVLFLDLSMPRKTGFECLTEIKENALFKDITVIVISTSYRRDMHYEQTMIRMMHDLGAEDYLRKPGDFEQLKKIVHQVLRRLAKKPA